MGIVDHFSKSLCLISVPGFPTAFETAELISNHAFRLFEIPEDIVSDQDMHFSSKVLSSYMEKLEV